MELMKGIWNPILLTAGGYHLTVIEDEPSVPLAQGPAAAASNGNFLAAVILIVLIAAAFALFVYLMECMRYRKRFVRLYQKRTSQAPQKASWNLWALKDDVREEEAMAVDGLL